MLPAGYNIFLIGPMGSGKTTIGKLVATQLGLEFLDCDQELEKATGASVNLIFDVEGEKGFRERESRLLEELSQRTGILVATGGGAVKSARNRKILRRAALVVWIRTTVDQQLARLSHDKTRPLLQTRDREARLHKLAAERDPLYEEVADLVFKSPNRSSKSAAAALSRLIRDEMRNRGREIRHAHR